MSEFPIKIPAIKLYRGDSFSQTYIFKNNETNQPKNLVSEGWSNWVAQWRPEIDSDTVVNFSVTTSQASNGQILVSLSAAQTSDMKKGFWDLQATQNTTVRTWLAGKVEFEKDVTDV
jgi:hypothetical protein